MKRKSILLAALFLVMALAGCHGGGAVEENEGRQAAKEETTDMNMKIDDTAVTVSWEANDAVTALGALCADGPLEIQLSMYGGFEQVGPIGAALPRNDAQTVTQAGDIVLYAGDQMVVFYGSNSWAYTRLGHITDKTAEEMRGLLANGDVTVTITAD